MKKQEITQVFMYLLMMIVGGVLLMSLLVGCNVYEHEEVEIIRCPQIQDTVQIPDWDERGSYSWHSKKLSNPMTPEFKSFFKTVAGNEGSKLWVSNAAGPVWQRLCS